MFSLCEVSSYLWNSFVYIGKDLPADNDEIEKELGKSGDVGFLWEKLSLVRW